MDIQTREDGIMIQMEDYVDSIEDVKEIHKADRGVSLTKAEVKLSWLANSTRLNSSYTALSMLKRNNSAKISNLKNVLRVMKKAKKQSSKLKFSRIGSKEDLIILGIRDASFKTDKKQ